MPARQHFLTAWTMANVVGASAFLFFASVTWLEPNLRGEDVARGGDAFIWMLSAFPILAAFTILNLIWVGWSLRKSDRTGRLYGSYAVVAVIWAGAVVVDHFRSLGFG